MSRCRLLNREFKQSPDGFVHLATFGNFQAVLDQGKTRKQIVQRIDKEAGAQMVRNFNLDSKRPNFAGLLVDFDHESEDLTKRSTAAGWITDMELRPDGVWVKIRFSSEGQDAVDGGNYRFISPVFDPADLEPVDGSDQIFRPLRLDSAGLTNKPNIKGAAPITNRAPGLEAELEKLRRDLEQRNNDKAERLSKSADEAAESIGRLANREMKLTGCSILAAFCRVMNRHQGLSAAAMGRANVRSSMGADRISLRSIASGMILNRAQGHRLLGLAGAVMEVQKQNPRLAKLANRATDDFSDPGWSYVADLEPKAKEVFISAVQNPPAKSYANKVPPPLSHELNTARQEERKPNLRMRRGYEPLEDFLRVWGKAKEQADENGENLSPEAFWEQAKEDCPEKLLAFILSFDDQTVYMPSIMGGGIVEPVGLPNAENTERYARRRIIMAGVHRHPGTKLNDLQQQAVDEAIEHL